MVTLTSVQCSSRKAEFKYSVSGRVTCGGRTLPIALSMNKDRCCTDVRIALFCAAENEPVIIRKLVPFARLRRALVYSIQPEARKRRQVVKIGILFPMDGRHRGFRQYLDIAEHVINGIDKALNKN